MILAIVYNALVSTLTALVAAYWYRHPSRRAALGGGVIWFVGMVGLALLPRGSLFVAIRLLCWGIFVELPFVLWLAAGILRQHRVLAIASVLLSLTTIGLGIDAFYVEPQRLEMTHYTVHSAKVKTPLRVAIIADLQTDAIGAYERHVLLTVLDEKPDLILLAGDYIQATPENEEQAFLDLRHLLLDLRFGAPCGTIAVAGNTDTDRWSSSFDGTRVQCIVKSQSLIVRDDVEVAALSESDSRDGTAQFPPTQRFRIALGHYPDYALSEIDADLLIAGHTHGGQVQLPFVGPLMTLSRVSRKWAAGGLFTIDPERQLILSRGIGMERGDAPRLRFRCRPQIVVVEIVPK